MSPKDRAAQRLAADAEDALSRVDGLGMTDAAVAKAAGLPPAFLTKSRQGLNRDPRAAASWAKLRRWLSGQKSVSRGIELAPEPAKSCAPVAPAGEGATLAQEIHAAISAELLGYLLTRIAALVAEGVIDLETAETLEKLIKLRAKLLKDAREEKAVKDVRALDVLLPDEVEALERYRASVRPKPIQPGEYVQPPTLDAVPQ